MSPRWPDRRELCSNGDGLPLHAKGLCHNCYRKAARRERGLNRPGRKADPSKPFSRFGGELSHQGPRAKCAQGHDFDGTDSRGRQSCSICLTAKANASCAHGHGPENRNTFGACTKCGNERQRWYARARKYGLSREQILAMLEAQAYTCMLCPKVFDLQAKRPFAIDHDHDCCPGSSSCGKCVRGLLCDRCNVSLRDDLEWHERAIEYLNKYRSGRGRT